MNSEDKIWFYEVTDDYIDYLRKFDKKVPNSKILDRKHTRKYIGVLFTINGFKYIAPLSSYIDKHNSMKESIDFLKVKDYAVINLNNMIPVIDECISKVMFEEVSDEYYKDLLENEYKVIKTKKNQILKNANIVYNQVTKYKKQKGLINRCCDFNLLEEKAEIYFQKNY